jgi:raffinose/stachyose/melibiose transport system substrate-binding protein
MKLRKFAAMTMAVAMLGGTLAGCGGAASSTASSSADSTPAESTSTAESTETSGEKVNIKLFTGKIETIDVMNEIIDEFNASQDHIVVEQEYQKDASNVIKIKCATAAKQAILRQLL